MKIARRLGPPHPRSLANVNGCEDAHHIHTVSVCLGVKSSVSELRSSCFLDSLSSSMSAKTVSSISWADMLFSLLGVINKIIQGKIPPRTSGRAPCAFETWPGDDRAAGAEGAWAAVAVAERE